MKILTPFLFLLLLTACNDSYDPPKSDLPPESESIADCEQSGCTVTATLSTNELNLSEQPIVISATGSIILE